MERERYKNKAGDSGVLAYEIAPDTITVQFADKESYVYTYASTGRQAVEKMKQLARQGKGLATYINKYVRGKYARKLT